MEVYDAFVDAGASEAKARAAAEAIPISDQLATKQDIGDLKSDITALEAKMWKAGITIASLAVLLNKFLDWVITGK